MTDTNTPDNRPRIVVSVDDDKRFGEYANFVTGSFTPQDFTLDFGQFMTGSAPDEVKVDVVTRVKMSPQLAPRLVQTLQALIEGYNQAHGAEEEEA